MIFVNYQVVVYVLAISFIDFNYDGVIYFQSKGGILARACEYITELRGTQEKLIESLDEKAQLIEEAKNLRQMVNQLKDENSKLKDQIEKRNVFMIST